jgi:uncharacterized protein (TIGR04255 family)
MKEMRGGTLNVKIVDNNIEANKEETKTMWEFSDKSSTKKMIISQNFILIEYAKYKDFKKYLPEITKIITAFERFFNFNVINRIGLRYVNIVTIKTGDPINWDGLINKNLYTTISKFIDDKTKILKNLEVLEYKDPSYNLTFWFGMHNSEYPNNISRKEFVLDYDCYYQEQFPPSEIFTKVILFNKTINSWFEHSIDNGLRSIMKGD